jgi:hypothetical protein
MPRIARSPNLKKSKIVFKSPRNGQDPASIEHQMKSLNVRNMNSSSSDIEELSDPTKVDQDDDNNLAKPCTNHSSEADIKDVCTERNKGEDYESASDHESNETEHTSSGEDICESSSPKKDVKTKEEQKNTKKSLAVVNEELVKTPKSDNTTKRSAELMKKGQIKMSENNLKLPCFFELAKTNRAFCKNTICKKKIDKNSIKFCYIKGKVTQSYHLSCIPEICHGLVNDLGGVTVIAGSELLNDDDLEIIIR